MKDQVVMFKVELGWKGLGQVVGVMFAWAAPVQFVHDVRNIMSNICKKCTFWFVCAKFEL